MARIRSVKPEFADDEKLATISRDARLLFILMWIHSDDYGVVKGNPIWLKAQIFPYDDLKPGQFEKWLEEISNIGRIRAFNSDGEKFFYIKNFRKHQRIDHPSKLLRNPSPPADILTEDYGENPMSIDTPKPPAKKQRKSSAFSPYSEEFRLSELLSSFILDREPSFKKPDIQKWAKEMDAMLRIDKRSIEEVEAVIKWCQADSFWQNNILSTSKLREKYSQLLLKMKQRPLTGTGATDERKRNFLGKA